MIRSFTLPVAFLSIVMTVCLVLSVAAAGESANAGPPEPEGYTDRICDTPQNLTGSIPVATGVANSDHPSVVWDGSAYGMVWSDERDGNFEIYFSRVAADGTVLIPPTRVTTDPGTSSYPSLVWTGIEFGVAWQDSRTTTTDIYFARLSASGAKIGTDVQITSDADSSGKPSLVWTGSEYGVAWQDGRSTSSDIYFARISGSGVKQGSDVQITSDAGTSELPSLAWAGTEYGVIWQDSRTTVTDLYFARISAAGVKVGGDSQITSDFDASYDPSMVWSGTEYGVAWYDIRSTAGDIYFARVTMAGGKIGSDVQITSAADSSYDPSIAWTGSEYGIAWPDMRDGNSEIYLARVSAAGAKVNTEVRLTTEGTASSGPALAFGTLGYGVAYDLYSPKSIRFVGVGCHNDSSAPYCPSGVRVSGNSSFGVTVAWTRPGIDYETEIAYHRVYRDGGPVGITTDDTFTDSPRPSGTPSYQVVAVNANARESLNCTVVTAPVPEGDCGDAWTGIQNLATAQSVYSPAIAWDGHAYGVTWSDNRYGNNEILFARVSSDGALLVPPTRVTNDSANSGSPSIAWTGSTFGIVWQDTRTAGYDLYFTRVDTGGNKLLADVQLTTDAANSLTPTLVWTGYEFAVAWFDSRSTGYDIYVNLFDNSGSLYDADIQITSASSASWYPSLVWTGTDLGVTWQDNRDGNWEVYFNRLDSYGYPIGGNVRITSDSASSTMPDLAWTGTEYGLAWTDSRSGGDYEVYFSRLSAAGAKVGSDLRITDFPGPAYEPDLIWTGAEYIVAWGDERYSATGDIFDATLDSSGYKIGDDRRLTATETYELAPILAVGGRGFGLLFKGSGNFSDTLDFIGLGCGAVDNTPPPCPSTPVETGRTPTSVTLGWGAVQESESDFGHYAIYKDGIWAGATLATTWTDAAFDPVSGPAYHVLASNASGATSGGCPSVETADTTPPTCPENLLASAVTASSATLSWLPAQDAKSGLRRYQVYRNDTFLTSILAGTTTCTDGTVSGATTYNYAVRAEDWASNTSTGCDTAVVWVSTAPILLFLTKGADHLNADLDWNDVGLNQYVVYRSASAQSASELKRVPLSATTDPVLNDGVRLWFYYIQQRE